MNKLLVGYIMILAVFVSCKKTETLEPFSFPFILEGDIIRVEFFEDETLMVITDQGIFIKHADGQEHIIDPKPGDILNSSAFRDLDFYKSDKTDIYGVSNNAVLTITNDDYEWSGFQSVNLVFASRPGYAIAPNGDFLRSDFGPARINNQGNYVNDIQLSIWDGKNWDGSVTSIPVQETYTETHSLAFGDEGELYIVGFDIFLCTYHSYDNIDWELLVPVNDDGESRLMYNASVFGNNVYGYDNHPTISSGPFNVHGFSSASGIYKVMDIYDECSIEFNSSQMTKILRTRSTDGYLYSESTFNSFSLDNIRGEIYHVDFSLLKCDSKPILATGLIQNTSVDINDVAYNHIDDVAYLGTNEGLVIYDFQTNETVSYLDQIIDLNVE